MGNLYISLLMTNKPGRFYAKCGYCAGNCPVSRVITTGILHKSRGNIQYLDMFIEIERFERCVGAQVQFALEKNGQ
jgi:hypothetical protein